ncbi:MAG: PilN domain-containing protein [Desulfobacterales bacterium]|nr:PilN domain-containing protein [Desulfobacterales bacterium]
MIRINLLPFRAARKKENIRRQLSIFVLMFAFTAVTLVYYNGTLNDKLTTLETEIEAKKRELATYKKDIQEIQQIKKRLEDLQNKTRIINQLNVNREVPLSFLDSINELIIEKRMWLTNLRLTGRSVSIKGIALDNKTVADFMTRLEKSKLYTNINLQTVNQQTILKYNLKSFDISCQKAAPQQTTAAKK